MSFESFLTYDAPTSVKKKKKPSSSSSSSHSRPSHSSSSRNAPVPPPPAPSSSSSSSSSSKVSKSNGAQRSKRQHSGSSSAPAAPEKRRKVSLTSLQHWFVQLFSYSPLNALYCLSLLAGLEHLNCWFPHAHVNHRVFLWISSGGRVPASSSWNPPACNPAQLQTPALHWPHATVTTKTER